MLSETNGKKQNCLGIFHIHISKARKTNRFQTNLKDQQNYFAFFP